MSFDVKLHRSHAPVFPAGCMQCQSETLGETLRYTAESNSHFWFLTVLARKFRVDVPVCANCQTQVLRERRTRQFVFFVLLAIGLAAGFGTLAYYRGPFKKFIVLGIVLLVLLPYIIWIVWRPPLLNMSATSNTVEYEFKYEGYANEFARLNSDAMTK